MKRKFRAPSVALAGCALLASTTVTSLQASGASATPSRTTMAGTAVPAAAKGKEVGAVSKSSTVNFEAVLEIRDSAGAQALVRAVSDPASSSYRRYLTTAEWEARFSPTSSEVAQAKSWLAAQGFRVGVVSRDRITISVSGSAAQVEKAFDTSLGTYRLAGHTVRYASTDLSVPTTLATTIAGVLGVDQNVATPDDSPQVTAAGTVTGTAIGASGINYPPAPSAFLTHSPCGTYYGEAVRTTTFANTHPGYKNTMPDTVCGYIPAQLRSAHSLSGAATGAGVTVAVVDAYDSATIANDATTYFAKNDPSNPFSNADFRQIDAVPFDDQAECAASGWLDEQAIDVESVHGMAPNAHITYVGAQDCVNGLFDAEQLVIDNGLANVVTNSWGDGAGDLLDDSATKTAYDDLFMLADSTGMTVLFSSGDDGDNFGVVGFSSADYPPSSPYVTAVGGTTLQIGAAGEQTGQLGWATGRSFLCTANLIGLPGCTTHTLQTWLTPSLDGASGGFTSYYYTQPWYQAGVVPAALALRNESLDGPVPTRVEPDISLDADPATGFLIGLHETFGDGSVAYGQTRYRGTSLASPLLAGVIADADQLAGTPVGFLNPAIYKLDTESKTAIQDIVPGGDQSQYRDDYADELFQGATGVAHAVREITYRGEVQYCDGTGNCASRPMTLTTAKGFDSLTGLGSIGPTFVEALAKF